MSGHMSSHSKLFDFVWHIVRKISVTNHIILTVQFKFATTLEKLLIISGSVAAVVGGAALPILMILKGIAVQVGVLQILNMWLK